MGSDDDEETENLRDELSKLKSELQAINMKNASALDRAAKADEKVEQLEEDKVDL